MLEEDLDDIDDDGYIEVEEKDEDYQFKEMSIDEEEEKKNLILQKEN